MKRKTAVARARRFRQAWRLLRSSKDERLSIEGKDSGDVSVAAGAVRGRRTTSRKAQDLPLNEEKTMAPARQLRAGVAAEPPSLQWTPLYFRFSSIDSVTTRDYYGTAMLSIGIKELKARLSEYVRAARAGETVLVTDRGEVVAALGPASDRVREIEPDSVDARLAEAERRGLVTRAKLPKEGWTWRPRGLRLSNEQIDALLDELRADRFEP